MKKKIYFILSYVLPILILVSAVIFNKYYSHSKLFPEENLATNVNQDYVKLENDWLTNQFDIFWGSSNHIEKITQLNVNYNNYDKSGFETGELYNALDKVLQFILADNFDSYLSSRSISESSVLKTDSVNYQMAILKRFYDVDPPPETPIDIHRLYWTKKTDSGKSASYWQSICWEKSWVECWKTQKADTFTTELTFLKKIYETIPTCGVVGKESSFQYSPSPEKILSENNEIQGATAYFLFKTSEEKAYPLIFQFYFDPLSRIWFPTHLIIGYVGNTKFDLIF